MKWRYVPVRPIAEYRRLRDIGERARLLAADATATLNNQGARIKIKAYKGQRGWTFGVSIGGGSGTPRRTKESDAVRKWFAYSRLDGQQKSRRSSGTAATVESNLKKLHRIGRGLGAADAKQLGSELERLLRKFGSRAKRPRVRQKGPLASSSWAAN